MNTQLFCEKCGKPISGEFGSGRFCSRSCANSRTHSQDTKNKISNSCRKQPIKYCKICNKVLDRRNKTGYCSVCFKKSQEFHELKVRNGKIGYLNSVERGTHVGWKSRNIQSYPEQFRTNVLNNNNIKFDGPNKPLKKPDNSNYFLDFYIIKNGVSVDLEIDGKQYKYKERMESDNIRDKYITSLGIIVYRID